MYNFLGKVYRFLQNTI